VEEETMVEDILERARGGERVSFEEGLRLYQEADAAALAEVAHELRCQRTDPGLVTYLVDRNVNYANECVTDCLFCAFYRPPGHREAYVLSREELGEKLSELESIGGTRVLMQGGNHPDLRLEWYEDLLAWMREAHPTIEANAFSPSEVDQMARLEGISVEEVLTRLQAAGLAGLPGGGAEILDDEVRRRISPKKQSAQGWLDTMRIAQRLGLATSASMVIGWKETTEQRVRHLDRLRQVNDEAAASHGNGFTAFICWTAQLESTPLGRTRLAQGMGASAEEYLRHVAFSRIYLDNFVHLQASWPTMGEEVARQALHAGADDYGSTMMEENVVSPASGGATQRCIEIERICERIREAGFTPAQRDTRYKILRVHELA
jgi:cyclic dehypoxanthinyl futalosine synthase